MKPITRWQQIRDAVAGLESEIWHFRTRTGKYEHQASGTALVNSLVNSLLVNSLPVRACLMLALVAYCR